jgi:hypothetical protein
MLSSVERDESDSAKPHERRERPDEAKNAPPSGNEKRAPSFGFLDGYANPFTASG